MATALPAQWVGSGWLHPSTARQCSAPRLHCTSPDCVQRLLIKPVQGIHRNLLDTNTCTTQRYRILISVHSSCYKNIRLPTPVILGFPCGSAGKESACSAGDLGSISGLRRSPGEGKGYPWQNSGLENSMDCIVHGVGKS